MVEHKEKILELYSKGLSAIKIAKQICLENNLQYNDNVRRNLSKIITRAKNKGVFDECEADAAFVLGLQRDTLKQRLNGRRGNKTTYIYA